MGRAVHAAGGGGGVACRAQWEGTARDAMYAGMC